MKLDYRQHHKPTRTIQRWVGIGLSIVIAVILGAFALVAYLHRHDAKFWDI